MSWKVPRLNAARMDHGAALMLQAICLAGLKQAAFARRQHLFDR